ncbi:hypothetical protein GCM10011513_25120 [Franconibacter daqui]|nr:hypothetical protein GCM10011513_25120 [Franconibacter daqui]
MNKLATLCITEVDLGAFSVIDDPNTKIKISDGAIHLTVRGNIYQFRNFPSYLSSGVAYAHHQKPAMLAFAYS